MSRALLADDAVAEKLYQDAIEQLSHCRGNLRKARAHLLYGEWLRRQKRRLDARTHLHAAHEMFLRTGADAFAERARLELAATGERAQANQRDSPRPHPAGGADRAPGLPGRHERRDRRTAVPQREHRGLSPTEGLPEARPDIATPARPGAARVDGAAAPGRGDIPDLGRRDLLMLGTPLASSVTPLVTPPAAFALAVSISAWADVRMRRCSRCGAGTQRWP